MVVLLSHNGMDVDLKLASRVTGIDVIFGGHTHDATPQPSIIANRSGKTLVTNGGSNGKFLGVMDLDVKAGRVAGYRYRLMPVFANLIPADAEMDALIQRHRQPFLADLQRELATTETLLYRRGNFNGSFDQLILDAMLKVMDAEIGFSAGFRWGTALLPGAMWKQAWAFLLFRLLDIRKPGPIGWADRNVTGAFGVMLDDLIAAAITLLIFALWIRLFG